MNYNEWKNLPIKALLEKFRVLEFKSGISHYSDCSSSYSSFSSSISSISILLPISVSSKLPQPAFTLPKLTVYQSPEYVSNSHIILNLYVLPIQYK